MAMHPAIAQARETGKAVIGRCEIDNDGKIRIDGRRSSIAIARDRSSVMFAIMNLSWLSDETGDQLLPPGTTVTIFNEAGITLAKKSPPDRPNGEIAAAIPLVRLAVSRNAEGVADLISTDGVPAVRVQADLAAR